MNAVGLTGMELTAYAAPILTQDLPAADFSDTPWWLSLIKALMVFVYLLLQVLVVIWFERRVIGRMQQRPGPNRFGPFGLMQTLADGLKLMMKEDVTPKNADKILFVAAPLIVGSLAFISFAIIPVGGTVEMFGHTTPLQLTDTPVATLLVLAVAGVGAYGFVLAGWSSGSTYPLLGGVRSTAMVISYEIAMGLALVAVFLYAGSMSTSQIVAAQASLWYVVPLFFSFVIYLITMVGETNRLPFDLAEGEGELGGGFHTEYSSMKFGMFFLGEYINMFTVSGLATTLFLGGWMAPPGIAAINDGMFNEGWWGLLWFTAKMWLFIFFYVWLRGSLPRVRYDQFMMFGWKVMIPAALVWVIAVCLIRSAQVGYLGDLGSIELLGRSLPVVMLLVVGIIGLSVIGALLLWDNRAQAGKSAELEARAPAAEVDPFADGYPAPPLPGQKLREPRPAVEAAAPVTVGARSTGATAADAHTTRAPNEPVARHTDETSEDNRG